MKTGKEIIKKVCPTPQAALRAMVKGLKNRKGLGVYMNSFVKEGHELNEEEGWELSKVRDKDGKFMCFGCAAIHTLQNLFNVEFNKVDWGYIRCASERARTLGLPDDGFINEFENVLDSARYGKFSRLLNWYGFSDLQANWCKTRWDNQVRLENNNWEEQLPKLLKIADEIESAIQFETVYKEWNNA